MSTCLKKPAPLRETTGAGGRGMEVTNPTTRGVVGYAPDLGVAVASIGKIKFEIAE